MIFIFWNRKNEKSTAPTRTGLFLITKDTQPAQMPLDSARHGKIDSMINCQ